MHPLCTGVLLGGRWVMLSGQTLAFGGTLAWTTRGLFDLLAIKLKICSMDGVAGGKRTSRRLQDGWCAQSKPGACRRPRYAHTLHAP